MSDIKYENITCEKKHNGQECIFSKKALTKLKMLATIGTVSALAVVTFSGCTNIRKDVEQLTTTQPTSSYVQMMKETTTTKHTIEETTQPTTTQPTTQENTTQKETQQTTTTTKKPIEQTTVKATQQEVEKTTKEVEQTQNIDKEYNKLFKQLNKELNKKSFSKEANKLFIDSFEALYSNYSSWKKGYKDLPSKSEYIKNNLIDVIKEIEYVDFYDINSKEAKKLMKEGEPLAWTEISEENELKIAIISESADAEEIESRQGDIENFLHEIVHCREKKITFNSDYFDGYRDIEQLILEGGATFHMKFAKPANLEATGSWLIADKKDEYNISYNKQNCLGYLVEMNAYEKLVYLAGYETVEKIEKGEQPISILQEVISKKYGKEKTTKFLKTMEEWYVEYDNSWKGDTVYNLAIELENQFLDFIKYDINSLKTEEEAKRYEEIYKFYKTKNLPQVEDTKTMENITPQLFSTKELDKLLKTKLQELSREGQER